MADLLFLTIFGTAALVCALLAPIDWALDGLERALAQLSPWRRMNAWGRWEAW